MSAWPVIQSARLVTVTTLLFSALAAMAMTSWTSTLTHASACAQSKSLWPTLQPLRPKARQELARSVMRRAERAIRSIPRFAQSANLISKCSRLRKSASLSARSELQRYGSPLPKTQSALNAPLAAPNASTRASTALCVKTISCSTTTLA